MMTNNLVISETKILQRKFSNCETAKPSKSLGIQVAYYWTFREIARSGYLIVNLSSYPFQSILLHDQSKIKNKPHDNCSKRTNITVRFPKLQLKCDTTIAK